jgi:hypothetical protein
MVETRGPDRVKRLGVIDDPNANLTRLEEWTHAARYALPHYLPPDLRAELGVRIRQIGREVDVPAEEPEPGDELPYEAPDWPEPEPTAESAREPERRPERDGPDFEF